MQATSRSRRVASLLLRGALGATTSICAAAFGSAPAQAARIELGDSHSCALTGASAAMCWGRNQFGAVGDGTTVHRKVPAAVVGLGSDVVAIAAGTSHSCALTTAGGVKCWGSNYYGQLGDGSGMDSLTPVDVAGLDSGVVAIATGSEHSCALIAGGGVKCWGDNWLGQVGDGTTENLRPTPANVTGLDSGAIAISASNNHTCALSPAGGAKCWGANGSGRLGNGTEVDSAFPVDVLNLGSGVRAISAGGVFTCALTEAGTVKCWGMNWDGELGDGSNVDSPVPVDVQGIGAPVSAISVGNRHSCALTETGGLLCWGHNHSGKLGNGTQEDSAVPVNVVGLDSGVRVIAAGYSHTCAMTAIGELQCWGSNQWGQIGDGVLGGVHLTPYTVVGFDSETIFAEGFEIVPP